MLLLDSSLGDASFCTSNQRWLILPPLPLTFFECSWLHMVALSCYNSAMLTKRYVAVVVSVGVGTGWLSHAGRARGGVSRLQSHVPLSVVVAQQGRVSYPVTA